MELEHCGCLPGRGSGAAPGAGAGCSTTPRRVPLSRAAQGAQLRIASDPFAERVLPGPDGGRPRGRRALVARGRRGDGRCRALLASACRGSAREVTGSRAGSSSENRPAQRRRFCVFGKGAGGARAPRASLKAPRVKAAFTSVVAWHDRRLRGRRRRPPGEKCERVAPSSPRKRPVRAQHRAGLRWAGSGAGNRQPQGGGRAPKRIPRGFSKEPPSTAPRPECLLDAPPKSGA